MASIIAAVIFMRMEGEMVLVLFRISDTLQVIKEENKFRHDCTHTN